MAKTSSRFLTPCKHFPILCDQSSVLDPTIHMVHINCVRNFYNSCRVPFFVPWQRTGIILVYLYKGKCMNPLHVGS